MRESACGSGPRSTLDDVDVAQLYDGFTPVTVAWIEALGACGRGEFGDWVGDGTRLGPGGDFPLNTAGGQLAEGRLHGIGFLNEAVLQLRGQCEDRQVPSARGRARREWGVPAVRRDGADHRITHDEEQAVHMNDGSES